MALMKYKEIIKLAKDKVNEVLATPRAHEMQKRAEHEISKLDCSLAEQEQAIQELAAKYPIDFDKLIGALDELELTKRRKTQFQQIIKEMFADEVNAE